MILDNVPGKPLRWTRATKWALTPAVVLICLSLTGCSGHSPTLQPNPLISTPNEEVGLGSTLAQEQHPCDGSLEVEAYRRGQETLRQENGNEKEAARHFIKAIEIADEITDRNPCDEAYKAQYELAELLRKMSPSDPDEEIREINDRVDSYLAKKAGEIGEFPFPNPSDHEKRQYGLITLAVQGDLPEAQFRLGDLFQENGNEKEAARHFIKAIEIADEITDRNPCDEAYKAQYGLAGLLPKMSPSDPDEEIKEINDRVDSYLAKKAGEIGEFPFPNPSDHKERQYGLITLAAQGDLPEAQLSLGALFLSNTPFMEKILPTLNPKDLCKDSPGRTPNSDPDGYMKKAFDWFQKASTPRAFDRSQRESVLEAIRVLGMMYLYDLVSDDQSDAFLRCQKALYFSRQAAQDLDPAALGNLGVMYEHGHGLREGNLKEAMRYYHLGAQLGNPDSQLSLARRYLLMDEAVRKRMRNHTEMREFVEDLEERLGKSGKASELRSAWEHSLGWLAAFDETCDRLSKEFGKTEAECARGPESDYESMVKGLAAARCPSSSDPENCNMEEFVRDLVKRLRGWQEKDGYKMGTGFVVYSETRHNETHNRELPSTYILTNAHVVTPEWSDREPYWENMEKPTCSETEIFFENSPIPVFVQPEIIGRSPHYDLALLKLRMDAEERQSVIFRSEEESLDLGEKSYAFGYPYADDLSFEMHATEGNVSATAGMFSDPGTFETEAALRPGNSGGPILDSKGQVIGVATSIWRREHTVNFAISHKAVLDFFDQLKNEGKIDFTLEPDREAPSLEPEAIAEKARDLTVHIQCWTDAPSSALTLSE